jgi:superfamily II DNA or RNA helicase
MSVREGIEGKFLTPIRFFQWRVKSDSNFRSDDKLEMNREHLKYNANVYKHAANLANMAVEQGKRRVLVLVDEVSQLKMFLNAGVRHKVGFAHGGVTKDNKKIVPQEYWKSDPRALVLSFDRGEFPILVGTSCIGMGTDTKSPNFGIDLVGLTSEIRVRQSVGRFTRLFEGKTDSIYNDYDVFNIDETTRHAKVRARIFNDIYGKVKIKDV